MNKEVKLAALGGALLTGGFTGIEGISNISAVLLGVGILVLVLLLKRVQY